MLIAPPIDKIGGRGLSAKKCTEIMKRNPVQVDLRKALLSKVVPSVKKLGLLDFSDGWLWKSWANSGFSSTRT